MTPISSLTLITLSLLLLGCIPNESSEIETTEATESPSSEGDSVTSFGDELCGNNIIDNDEVCDGVSIFNYTCETLGYDFGFLKCDPSCDGFDISECSYFPLLTANQIVCPEEGLCLGRIAPGVWTSVFPTCGFDFLESQGIQEIDFLESCNLEESYITAWSPSNIRCYSHSSQESSIELCFVEVTEGWWTHVQTGCNFIPHSQPLWGSWDSSCYMSEPMTQNLFFHTSCEGSLCHGVFQNEWVVQIRPSCFDEDSRFINPSSACDWF